jgi:hypothetical protein
LHRWEKGRYNCTEYSSMDIKYPKNPTFLRVSLFVRVSYFRIIFQSIIVELIRSFHLLTMYGGRFVTDKEDSDLELYGTSPGVIAFFMILISLIVPIGIIPFNAWVFFGYSDLMIYSLFWFYSPGLYLPFIMIPLFMLLNLWLTIPLTIFNIAYIRQIVQYYRGKCTRYSAIWVGILSLTFPTLLSLTLTAPSLGITFIGPIPIQFIVGLIFMFKYPGPEMTSPWRGDLVDRHWWSPKRPDWWLRMFPPSKDEEKKELELESN